MEARERLAITRIAIVLAKADGMSAADAHMFHDSAAAILKALNLTDTAALALMDGDGAVVPKEASWEMQIEGRDAILDEDDSIDLSTDDARAAYDAMLAASTYKETTNDR